MSFTGTFSAAGSSGKLLVIPGDSVTYTAQGDTDFIGTLVLEKTTNNQTYTTLSTHIGTVSVPITAAMTGSYANNTNENEFLRLTMVDFGETSNNVDYTLSEVASIAAYVKLEQGVIKNKDGLVLMQFNEDGVLIEGVTSGGGTLTPDILILPNATTPAQTTDASVVWDSDTDLLTVGTGAARKTMLDTNSTQTGITGKTFTSPTLTTPVLDGLLSGSATVAKRYVFNSGEKVGATSGWVVGAATNIGRMATLPASQSGSTLVIRIPYLRNNDIITAFHLIGQIESAGGSVTVDSELFRASAIASDNTFTSLGAMTQLAVTADTAMSDLNTTKTLAVAETCGNGETYYIVITATTAASTDIDILGAALIMTEQLFSVPE